MTLGKFGGGGSGFSGKKKVRKRCLVADIVLILVAIDSCCDILRYKGEKGGKKYEAI
jgi:hypothetical protein